MIENQVPVAGAMPKAARLWRWLPMVGLVIGLGYLAGLYLISSLFDGTPQKLMLQIDKLAFDGPVEAMDCGLTGSGKPYDSRKVFVTAFGARPDVFEITLPAAPARAILLVSDAPDKVALLPCRNGRATGPLQMAGDTLPFSVRDIKTPQVAFALDHPEPGSSYLLHIVQEAALAMPIVAEERDSYFKAANRRLLLHAALCTAVAFMILYNLTLSLLSRMPAFLFNGLSTAGVLVLNIYLTGLGAAYFWPNHPAFSNMVLLIGLSMPVMFSPFFIYRFIAPPDVPLLQAMPWLLFWPGAALTALLSTVFVPYYVATLPLILMMTAVVLVSAWHLVRSSLAGNPRAGVMLVALLGAVVPGAMLGIGKEFLGWNFGAITPHLNEMLLLLEAMLFTLALAYQIRLSRWREMAALEEINIRLERAKTEMLETIDNNRTRLASDLHDSAGQMLGLISSRLKRAALDEDMTSQQRNELRDTAGLAGDTLAEIRRISHDLHPATLTHLGLTQALRGLCKQVTQASGVRLDSHLEFAENRLNKRQSLQVYRIIQELMANMVKHSGARDAALHLVSDGARFHLHFSDNGQAGASVSGPGLGQAILEQRAAALKARLSRKTGELGTVVTLTFVTDPKQGPTREEPT